MKRVASTLLVALGLLSPFTFAQQVQPNQLNVLYVTVEANVDAVRYAAQRYQELTGIRINIDSYPQTAWRERLFAEISARSSHYDVWLIDVPEGALTAPHSVDLLQFILNPDVVDLELLSPETFIPRTIMQSTYNPEIPWSPPLEEQLPEYTRTEPITVTSFEQMRADGYGFYGIPFHPNVLTMAYRQDYFDDPELQAQFEEQYGRELAPPEDWNQYLEVCEFFTREHNTNSPTEYGCTLMARRHESLYTDWRTWLATHNVLELDTDLLPTFCTNEGIAATQFYVDLINTHRVVPDAARTWTWDEVATAFGSGLTAIAMNYHRMLLDPDIEAAGGEVGFAPVPGQRQGDGSIIRAPHYGTYYLALNRYARNQEAAYKFIEWLASPEMQQEYAQFLFHSSRRPYYLSEEVIATRPEYWPTFAESLEVGWSRPRLTVFREYSEIIQSEVSQALAGVKTVEQALDDAARRVVALFTRAGYYGALGIDPNQVGYCVR